MEALIPSIIGSAASALVGGLFTKKPSAPAAVAPPTVAPVTAMPDPLAQKAQARRKAAIFGSTRMSAADTVLTGGDAKLG